MTKFAIVPPMEESASVMPVESEIATPTKDSDKNSRVETSAAIIMEESTITVPMEHSPTQSMKKMQVLGIRA